MTTDLKLDLANHDIQFENGDFALTLTQSESLQQRLTIKLLTFMGEWYLNLNEGIPYFQSIFGKNRSKESIDLILKRAIISEPEVLQLVEFQSFIDSSTRLYSLSFRVRSANDDSIIPIEIEL